MPNVADIFIAFLKLGCMSFGGPIAHLGYFREEFVARKQWLDDREYADLVSLCQLLPGPASSQVGMGIGYKLSGKVGAFAAWLGFTLPSAALMIAAALMLKSNRAWMSSGVLHGLKIAAVVIVAQAVIAMFRSLCKDNVHKALAVAGALLMMTATFGWLQINAAAMQIPVLLLGALAGWWMSRGSPIGKLSGIRWSYLLAFAAILISTLLIHNLYGGIFRAGSLVFGGGHVVLPLLEGITVNQNLISADRFMAGYGLAQAVPGPLFTFASFLGTAIGGSVLAGVIATVAIFLPSFFMLFGLLPAWTRFGTLPKARMILGGVNAAVVGILFAAWINPVASTALIKPVDVFIAASAFAVLMLRKAPPWAVVAYCAVAAALI